MTIFILVIAVLFEGETHIFQYGNQGRPVEFPTQAACERVLREQEREIPGLLAKSPGATLQAIRCIPAPAKGGV